MNGVKKKRRKSQGVHKRQLFAACNGGIFSRPFVTSWEQTLSVGLTHATPWRRHGLMCACVNRPWKQLRSLQITILRNGSRSAAQVWILRNARLTINETEIRYELKWGSIGELNNVAPLTYAELRFSTHGNVLLSMTRTER